MTKTQSAAEFCRKHKGTKIDDHWDECMNETRWGPHARCMVDYNGIITGEVGVPGRDPFVEFNSSGHPVASPGIGWAVVSAEDYARLVAIREIAEEQGGRA